MLTIPWSVLSGWGAPHIQPCEFPLQDIIVSFLTSYRRTTPTGTKLDGAALRANTL